MGLNAFTVEMSPRKTPLTKYVETTRRKRTVQKLNKLVEDLNLSGLNTSTRRRLDSSHDTQYELPLRDIQNVM